MNYPELERTERKRLWGRLLIRIAIIIGIVIFVVFIMPSIISTLFPFIAALVMTWFFHPLVRKIHEKIRIPRKILSFVFVILFFIIVGGLITLFFYKIISEVAIFINNLIKNDINLSTILSSDNILSGFLSTLPENVSVAIQDGITNIILWINEVLSSSLSSISSRIGNFIAGVPSFFFSLVVFLTAMYYILADYPNLRALVSDRFSGELRKFMGFIKISTVAAFGAYLRAQLFLSLGVFVILLIGFAIIGQKFAFLLAFVLAILDFIPVIGSGSILVPWALITLITGNYTMTFQLMLIWGVVILFRRLFEPKIVGSQTNLSPLLSLLSMYIGMRIAGVTGMIFAPVFIQVFKQVCKAGLFAELISDAKLFIMDCVGILRNKSK